MADNLSALTQQISKFSSTASTQTNSFRQAAGDQNRSITKMIRDLANHFVAQRGSLENVSSAVEDSVEQTSDLSRKIDSNSSLTRQSISLLDSIATQIRNSNSLLSRISSHGETNNSFLKTLLGVGVGAAAGYLAGDQIKKQVSGGDNSLFGNSDQTTGKSSNGATPSSPSGGTTKPTSSGDSSPSTSLGSSTPITVGQGATPAGASYKEKIKNSSNNFNAVAPGLMANLMKDFKLTKEQASGILGNLGHESAGLHADINEGKPLKAGSRGGYGLAQWTGSRRKDLEKFAKENELPVNSVDTQYQFLKKELTGNKQYARILNNVRQEKTPEGAARAFLPFETGGDPRAIVAMGSRNKFAKMANSIDLSQQPTTVASNDGGGDGGDGGDGDATPTSNKPQVSPLLAIGDGGDGDATPTSNQPEVPPSPIANNGETEKNGDATPTSNQPPVSQTLANNGETEKNGDATPTSNQPPVSQTLAAAKSMEQLAAEQAETQKQNTAEDADWKKQHSNLTKAADRHAQIEKELDAEGVKYQGGKSNNYLDANGNMVSKEEAIASDKLPVATPIVSTPIIPGAGGESDPNTGLLVASDKTPNLNAEQNLQEKQVMTSEIKQAALTEDSAPKQPVVNVSQPQQQASSGNNQPRERDPADESDSSTSPTWAAQIAKYTGEMRP